MKILKYNRQINCLFVYLFKDKILFQVSKHANFRMAERDITPSKLDQYISNGWVDTFRLFHDEPDRYSWWSYRMGARARNVGWRIDYFFTNEGLVDIVEDADILEKVMGSDHCPVTLSIADRAL